MNRRTANGPDLKSGTIGQAMRPPRSVSTPPEPLKKMVTPAAAAGTCFLPKDITSLCMMLSAS